MGFLDFLKKQSKANVDQSNQMNDVEMAKDDNSTENVDSSTGSDDFSGSDD